MGTEPLAPGSTLFSQRWNKNDFGTGSHIAAGKFGELDVVADEHAALHAVDLKDIVQARSTGGLNGLLTTR
ncbi:hypothetical protein D3C84_1166720 [compost metagenome]